MNIEKILGIKQEELLEQLKYARENNMDYLEVGKVKVKLPELYTDRTVVDFSWRACY
ncbi:hypothetical protein GF361_00150 [Candidatus Woesearchaeota archaeon]|nr:hypothetical protein [Candidatus Woesearchaeota archaeon]